MATVVVGGQASGVGKTSVICALLAAMPERRWTAIKITQCGHQPDAEKPCDCELDGRKVAISEEHDRTGSTDSSRYLAAGAVRALWVRTLPGYLGEAVPRIEGEIARAEDVVIESNSVLEFLRPEVYALVVAPGVADFKASAMRYLDRVDALLIAGSGAPWVEERLEQAGRAQRFAIPQPQVASPDFVAYVRRRLDDSSSRT